MAGGPSLRAQRSARRFTLRRMEYAILGQGMPQRRDPLRAQKFSLAVGCGVAGAALILDAVLGSAGHRIPADAAVVMSRQTGALFVRVDDRLRPVVNLTSARLILGSPATPHLVDEAALRDTDRGPMLGIPGAPPAPGQMMAARDLRWAVCDDADGTTTVAVGDDSVPPDLDPHTAVVVTATGGDGSAYLLYDGKRAMLDPGDPATARVLRIEEVAERWMSTTALNAIPEVPAIGAPRIEGSGQPSGISGAPIGAVMRVTRTASVEYYVALRGGLQRIGQLAAELIRFNDPTARPEIADVPAELITHSPLVDTLPVGTYPDQPPTLLDSGDNLCATWRSGRSGVTVGPRLPDGPGVVTLAGADGDGPAVDMVRIPPGTSLDVVDVATMGRYLITGTGVRFPVDVSSVTALGLSGTPGEAPWSIIGALPAGPQLARDAALVGRDILTTTP